MAHEVERDIRADIVPVWISRTERTAAAGSPEIRTSTASSYAGRPSSQRRHTSAVTLRERSVSTGIAA